MTSCPSGEPPPQTQCMTSCPSGEPPQTQCMTSSPSGETPPKHSVCLAVPQVSPPPQTQCMTSSSSVYACQLAELPPPPPLHISLNAIQWKPSCEATLFASEKWPFKRDGLSSWVEINTFMF